jgi:hypothetical protein
LNPRRTQRPVTVFEICSAGLLDYFDSALDVAKPEAGGMELELSEGAIREVLLQSKRR